MRKAKILFCALAGLFCLSLTASAKKANNAELFFNELKKHCGNSYEGTALAGGEEEPFVNQKLIMQVRECRKNEIRIPFMVGEDRSRTWVITLKNGKLTLKHDHRHKDGTSDDVTMYGGTASNEGALEQQVFPADQQTASMIAAAAANVWWLNLDEKGFTYNLRRMGTDRYFVIRFDFDKKLDSNPPAPWGFKD